MNRRFTSVLNGWLCPHLQEMQVDPTKQQRLGFITGLVALSKAATFERILFRATRGNMFLKQAEVDGPVVDPATGESVSVGASFC